MITSVDFHCKNCRLLFRVSVLGNYVKYVVCPECQSTDVSYMTDEQEEMFEEYI